MPTFVVYPFNNRDMGESFRAATLGKAKYQAWKILKDCYPGYPFTDLRGYKLSDADLPSAEALRLAEQAAAVERWDRNVPRGTPVRYWPGTKDDPPRYGKTCTAAYLLGGHTAVVWITTARGCIALSHVEVVEEVYA